METKMNMELFLNAVKERPALWTSSHPHYKNKYVIKKLWEEIKEEFFPDYDGMF